MNKIFTRTLVLLSVLTLPACGDGWEFQRTDEYLPYSNQRTAGSGVMYVRAKMMPKKEVVVEEVVVIEEPVVIQKPPEEVKPVLQAEEIFNDAQGKGTSTTSKVMPQAQVSNDKSASALKAEDLIQVAPKKVTALVIDTDPSTNPVDLVASTGVNNSDLEETKLIFKETEVKTNNIVAPKIDVIKVSDGMHGLRNLDDIYADPLSD